MKYRKFGKLDFQVSALGFGCMRLPTKDNKPQSGDIDEKEAIRLIRHAVDRGVNYIDTAYPYHNGNSEIVAGKALLDGYRGKVKLATKSPQWLINAPEDFDKFLKEQLKKLQTDHIDFYLLHALGKESWENKVLKFGLLEKAEQALRDGRIRHLGFSFHDAPEAFKPIVDGYDKWDFCQIQYNYMDVNNQAGKAGLEYAASKGLAVVVMEPLLGGRLAALPADIKKIFDECSPQKTPAQLALQWLWAQSQVSTLLSGMNSMAQLEENLEAAEKLSVIPLSQKEIESIESVRAAFKKRAAIPCTKCGYCMPCPSDVDIPGVIEVYNNGIIYNDMATSRFVYERFFPEADRASACAQCGVCEEKCPQGLKISKLMPMIDEKFK